MSRFYALTHSLTVMWAAKFRQAWCPWQNAYKPLQMLQKYPFSLIQLLRKQGRSALIRVQMLHQPAMRRDDICLVEILLGKAKHGTGLRYIHCIVRHGRRLSGA